MLGWVDDPLVFGLSSLIAFLVGGLVVAVDCWRQNSSEFTYSTYPVLLDPWGVLFCIAFGIIASLALAYVTYDPQSWLGTALSLKTTNPFVRAGVVGMSVMVIVRSKVLQLGPEGGDFGLEFIYLRGRDIILRRLRRRQANEKAKLIKEFIAKIIRIDDFPAELDQHISSLLMGQPGPLGKYRNQRDAIAMPPVPFAPENELWVKTYRVLTRNATDFVGIAAMREWLETQSR